MWSFVAKLLPLRQGNAAEEQQTQKHEQTASLLGGKSLIALAMNGDIPGIQQAVQHAPDGFLSRFGLGETMLHIAYLFPKEQNKKLSRWLVTQEPRLVTCQYTSAEYAGENALHMAIANGFPVEETRWLLAQPGGLQLVHQRATGAFFAAGGTCDWGELPLNFAVALNRVDIVLCLVQEGGADMDARDSRGDTCLHVAVRQKRPAMYKLLESLYRSQQAAKGGAGASGDAAGNAATSYRCALASRTNAEGFTPLLLAVHLGYTDIFSELWTPINLWSYAHVSCKLYPLEDVDDIWYLAKEKLDAKAGAGAGTVAAPASLQQERRVTALELLTQCDASDTRHELILSLFGFPVLRTLLDRKWAAYARQSFMTRFALVVLFLLFFSAVVLVRSEAGCVGADGGHRAFGTLGTCADAAVSCGKCSPWQCVFTAAAELLLLLGTALKAGVSIAEARAMGLRGYLAAAGATRLEITVSWSFVMCMLCLLVHEYVAPGPAWLTPILLAAASLLSYVYLLWFCLGSKVIGPSVIMMRIMLTRDLMRFLVIASVLLLGFTQAFFILNDYGGANPNRGLHGFLMRLRDSFVSMVSSGLPAPQEVASAEGSGPDDAAAVSTIESAALATVFSGLALLFLVLSSVMLLNLLVAMMGDTYSDVKENADLQWQMERARVILQIDSTTALRRRLPALDKGSAEQSSAYLLYADMPFLQLEVVNEEKFRAAERDEQVLAAAAALDAERAATAAAASTSSAASPKAATASSSSTASAASGAALTPMVKPRARARKHSVAAPEAEAEVVAAAEAALRSPGGAATPARRRRQA